jgi:hypothetical protein
MNTLATRPRLQQILPSGTVDLAPPPSQTPATPAGNPARDAHLALALLLHRHGQPVHGATHFYRYQALDGDGQIAAHSDDPAVTALAALLRIHGDSEQGQRLALAALGDDGLEPTQEPGESR